VVLFGERAGHLWVLTAGVLRDMYSGLKEQRFSEQANLANILDFPSSSSSSRCVSVGGAGELGVGA
jgi:hypothetical protein